MPQKLYKMKRSYPPRETLRQKQKSDAVKRKTEQKHGAVETAQMKKHRKDEDSFSTNVCKKFKKEH